MTSSGVGGDATGSGFGFGDMVEAIAAQSRRLAEMVAVSDLDVTVPSCPEWSVRDLAHHLGVGQWYWGANVAARNPEERSGADLTPLPPDSDLHAWLGWCTYSLLSALRDAGPDAPCWTWWGEPRTALAVGRHQAQEAAVHRWDAELSVPATSTTPLPTPLSTDGVPEFLEVMVGADASALPGEVTLTATDVDGASWTVGSAVGTGTVTRSAELLASASDLVLMLYRRLPVPDSDVVGDPILVASLLSLADTS